MNIFRNIHPLFHNAEINALWERGYFLSKIIQVQTAIVKQIIKVQNPISRTIKSSPIKGKKFVISQY